MASCKKDAKGRKLGKGKPIDLMAATATLTRSAANENGSMPLIWLSCVSWNEELNMTKMTASARRKPLKSRSMICLELILPQKPRLRPAPEKTICTCGINT